MEAIILHIYQTFTLKNCNEKKFYCLLHPIHFVGIMSQRLMLATFEKDKRINVIGNCQKFCPHQRASFYPIFAPVVAKLVNRKTKKEKNVYPVYLAWRCFDYSNKFLHLSIYGI